MIIRAMSLIIIIITNNINITYNFSIWFVIYFLCIFPHCRYLIMDAPKCDKKIYQMIN